MICLTVKQKAIARFIHSFRYDFDMSPTVYEIAYHFGLKIPSVFAHLDSLVKKRIITKSTKARSIRLIENTDVLSEFKIPGNHLPGMYSIPVVYSPFYKQPNKVKGEFSFDGKVYQKLVGEYNAYALTIDEDNLHLSKNLNLNDFLLINPDMPFIVEGSIILSSRNGKLSVCRCSRWRHGNFELIPWEWEEGSDVDHSISGDQADLNILGSVIGLCRTQLH